MMEFSTSKDIIYPVLYAGPISYYAQVINVPGKLDIYERLGKQNFKMRTRIYGANGIITLSVPVEGSSQKSPLNDVLISNKESWQRNHWKSIESAYKSSPFYEFYAPYFENLYHSTFETLLDFNLAVHKQILFCLQQNRELPLTNSPSPLIENDVRLIYQTKKPHPLSSNFPEYQQVFSYQQEFHPDLSILDLLFNLGPEAETYLLSVYNLIQKKD